MTTPPRTPYEPYPAAPYGAERRGGNAGRATAIIAVATVVVLGLIGIAVLLTPHGSAGHGRPAYRLSLPNSLDKGRYTLFQNASGGADGSLDHADGAPGTRGMTAVSGTYKETLHAAADDILDVQGYYGTVDDPDRAIQWTLTWMQDTGVGDLAVPAKQFTPDGTTEPVTCEVLTSTADSGERVFLPMCAWADSTTVAAVAETDNGSLATSPGSVDLDSFADRVSTIRGEVRTRVS